MATSMFSGGVRGWWLGLALVTGCGGVKPATSSVVSPPASSPARTSTASSSSQAALIEVSATETKVQGQPVADEHGALAALLSSSPTPNLLLRATPDAPQTVLMDVIQQAYQVKSRLEIEIGSVRAQSVPYHHATCWVFGILSPERVRLWLAKADADRDVTTFEPWRAGDATTEERARAALQLAAKDTSCHATLSIAPDMPLFQALQSWADVSEGEHFSSQLVVGVKEPPAPANRPSGGRMPPELIQGIVRLHFDDFRACYEKGLAKNAQLEGKVAVRFVIGRDGRVTEVSNGGSNLPDPEVRDCVLSSFQHLKFPEPEVGIVTVVYPIMLAPG